MSEFQKAFSEKGRENFDTVFCPYGKRLGEEYDLFDECFHCVKEKPENNRACLESFKKTISGKGNL